MFILYISFITAYVAFMIYTTQGWNRLKEKPPSKTEPTTVVSIVLPFRNEAKNLESFLESIRIQEYPKALFELILVDDHSEDKGLELVNSLKDKLPFDLTLISLPANLKHKKAAISLAVEQAKGEIIIATDCDTRRSASWISSIVSFYEVEKPDLIVAPVLMEAGTFFIEKFQAIEFLSLQWVTATYVGQENAILCNGANLIFSKSIFQELGGYNNTPDVVSGDDFFLLFKMKKAKKNIRYLLDKHALVQTSVEEKWNDFIQQRLRWAAKSKYAGENSFYLTGLYNTLFSIFMICLPFIEYDKATFPFYCMTFWGIKFLGDWHMLNKIAKFFDVKMSFTTYLPSFILYPFYICHTFINSLIRKPTWKGRSI